MATDNTTAKKHMVEVDASIVLNILTSLEDHWENRKDKNVDSDLQYLDDLIHDISDGIDKRKFYGIEPDLSEALNNGADPNLFGKVICVRKGFTYAKLIPAYDETEQKWVSVPIRSKGYAYPYIVDPSNRIDEFVQARKEKFEENERNKIANQIEEMNKPTSKTVKCKDCGHYFCLTEEDQKYYADNNYYLPVRCKKCRITRARANKNNTESK